MLDRYSRELIRLTKSDAALLPISRRFDPERAFDPRRESLDGHEVGAAGLWAIHGKAIDLS